MHSGGREHRLGEHRGEEIGAAPPASGQHTHRHRAGPDGDDRPEPGQRAHLAPQAHRTAAAEPQDRPAAALGHRRHLAFGIRRPRIADQIHQRDVLVTVGVEVTVLEIDVVLGRKALHRSGFARTPQDRLLDTAGEYAVFGGLEFVGERVGDAEEPRDRIDLDGQRRRAEHHGVPAGHVGAHQLAHLGVDPRLDALDEQPLADLVQVVDQPARQRRGGLADEVLELDAPQGVAQAGLDHAEQFSHAHVAAQQPLLGQDDRGEPGDQGAVQVEERADFRAGGAGHDLGHRAGQSHVRPGFRGVVGPPFGCAHEPDADRDDTADSVNEAGTARGGGSPASARISSKPSSRHWANSASLRTEALS